MAGKVGLVALLSLLAAQETERGAAARVAENAAIRATLDAAAGDYGLDVAALPSTEALSFAALDRVNAALREALIRLHEAVEARGDRTRHHAILRLYVKMAELRRLDLPPLPAR